MSELTFYYCKVCGNIVEKINDSGNDLICCARDMQELEPGTTDGKVEWHVPVVEISGDTVTVKIGENPHPMEKDHYIQWIEIATDKGIARKYLEPGDTSEVHFKLCEGEKVCEVYAYCNKHKLWKAPKIDHCK